MADACIVKLNTHKKHIKEVVAKKKPNIVVLYGNKYKNIPLLKTHIGNAPMSSANCTRKIVCQY